MFMVWWVRLLAAMLAVMSADTGQSAHAFTAARNPRRLRLWITGGTLLGLCAATILWTQASIPPDFFLRTRLIVYSWIVLPAAIVQVSLHLYWLRHPRAILDISLGGLLYHPHSPDRVAWADVARVSTASAYGHRYVRVTLADAVPLPRYRAASLLARINRGVARRTIEIHASLLDRSQAEIVTAIHNRGTST
jgi:hypothetical protein